jgi:hypothetical protein
MAGIVQETTLDRDRMELSLGDTLDVKTGILLAAITVLGALTSTLLGSSTIGKPLETAQIVSLGLLATGAFFAVWAIWPRNYLLPDLPDAYAKWMHDLTRHYEHNLEQAESEFESGIMKQANERIHRNHRINASKSRWLFRAFWPTLLALLIDLGTLASLGAIKLLS